jgi:diguanylate cyclase (GGDEF)-like protein
MPDERAMTDVRSPPGATPRPARWSNVLEWSRVDRCLLVAAISLVFMGAYWLRGEYLLGHRSVAPYSDFAFLQLFQRWLLRFLGIWAALFALGLWLRQKWPESQLLCHATVQMYSVCHALGVACLGPVTSPQSIVLLAGIACGLVLFDRRAIFLGVLSGVVTLVITALVVSSGRVPYAPLYASSPITGGRLSSWFWGEWAVVQLTVSLAMLLLIAHIVARLRDREQRLLRLSTTDELTGIANRRRFLEVFAVEYQRAGRYGTPLSCVVIDLDHFKQINDRYGHCAGDDVLVAAAASCKVGLRANDLIARWGGEEFVLLLPQTEQSGAESVAERCRLAIEAARVMVCGAKIGVTASLGVASLPDARVKSADDLLRLADDALYQAKEKGRNRVMLAS